MNDNPIKFSLALLLLNDLYHSKVIEDDEYNRAIQMISETKPVESATTK